VVWDAAPDEPDAIRTCPNLDPTPQDRQYRPPVIQYQSAQSPVVIEYLRAQTHDGFMTHLMRSIALSAALLAVSPAVARANCYADYKAKQDNPLKLHYGVVQLRGACNAQSAQSEIASRLAPSGWTLLNVMSVFGPEGLQQRKANAGPYYLRF
jgi:hypothetical protein